MDNSPLTLRITMFRNWSLLCAICLFAVSYKLWLPQSEFPQVPAFWFANGPALGGFFHAAQWCLLPLIFISLFSQLLIRRDAWRLQAGTWTFLSCLLLSGLFDQHRLQPWAYQFFFVFLFLLPGTFTNIQTPPNVADLIALQRCRWLAISIYLFSAISKFDYLFVQSMGTQFLDSILGLVNIAPNRIDGVLRAVIVSTFPLGELIVGVGLATGRFPKLFTTLAVVTHAVLLLILGPLGQNHQWGVLLWNVFFIGQAYLLFWPSKHLAVNPAGQSTDLQPDKSKGSLLPAIKPALRVYVSEKLATIGFWFVLLFPLTQWLGICDHWLAWELYAPRGSRVQVYVAAVQIENENNPDLNSLAPFVGQRQEGQVALWQEIRIDRWSLQSLGVPIYPEDRFQLGIALAIANRLTSQRDIEVLWQGPADRWTGKRAQQRLSGKREIELFCQRFFLNTRPSTD